MYSCGCKANFKTFIGLLFSHTGITFGSPSSEPAECSLTYLNCFICKNSAIARATLIVEERWGFLRMVSNIAECLTDFVRRYTTAGYIESRVGSIGKVYIIGPWLVGI